MPLRSTFVKTGLRLATLALVLATACTDPVDIDSGFEEAQPVVDAWLTDKPEPQTVNLWLTQDYFANAVPPPLTGAVVELSPKQAPGTPAIVFEESSPGQYTWTPSDSLTSLRDIDEAFALTVTATIDGQQRRLVAESEFRRVPPIDSKIVRPS